RRFLARFQGGSWKEWEACFWLSTLSTAPAFPQLPRPFFFAPPLLLSWLLRRALGLLFLLGLLFPIARNVQFDDHAVVHQPINRRRRHHRVFEDPFPFRERQVSGPQHAAPLVTFRQ